MPAPKPKTRDDLSHIEVDGEALVYDPETGAVHHLNPMANLVFQLTDGKATASESACGIAEAFGAPLDSVEEDVRVIVREFRRIGLLEARNGSSPPESPRERGAPTQRELIRLDVQPNR
jgi:PqqD family protein of HPr-rel-A system